MTAVRFFLYFLDALSLALWWQNSAAAARM